MITRFLSVKRSALYGSCLLALATLANANPSPDTTKLVTLSLPGGHFSTFRTELINGVAVAEGDILLSRSSGALSQRGFANNLTTNLWFDGIIPFVLDELSDTDTIERVGDAIDHWNTYSSVRFQEVTRAEINSGLVSDYLEFTAYDGCSSYVGRIGGAQPVWVSPSCTTGSIIHELGHAIGLLHEHTRTDRDLYIKVNEENVVDGKMFNFAIPDSTVTDLGDYDYGSIMHYGPTSFSANGQDTITALTDISGINMGQRVALSDGDLNAVDQLYGTDLSLTESIAGNFQSGATVSVESIVSNLGSKGANEIIYALEVPAGTNLVSAEAVDWECGAQAGAVTCTRDTLQEGTQSNLTLTLTVGATVPESLGGFVSSRTHDTNSSNNGQPLSDFDVDEARDALFEEPVLGSAVDGISYSNSSSTSSSVGAGAAALLWITGLLGWQLRRRSKRY